MKRNQSGNAVMFILVAIALFGALAYTFMKGSRSSQSNLSNQQAKLAAQDIISYSQLFVRTTNKLIQNGCPEKDIGFYQTGNSKLGAFMHFPAAPEECNLLSSTGGNLSLPTFYDNGYLDKNLNNWNAFIGGEPAYFYVNGIGTTNATNASKDLVFWVRGVKKEICKAINAQLGLNVDLSVANYTVVNRYNGLFTLGVTTLGGTFTGKEAACFFYGNNSGVDQWDYYTVMIAR